MTITHSEQLPPSSKPPFTPFQYGKWNESWISGGDNALPSPPPHLHNLSSPSPPPTFSPLTPSSPSPSLSLTSNSVTSCSGWSGWFTDARACSARSQLSKGVRVHSASCQPSHCSAHCLSILQLLRPAAPQNHRTADAGHGHGGVQNHGGPVAHNLEGGDADRHQQGHIGLCTLNYLSSLYLLDRCNIWFR